MFETLLFDLDGTLTDPFEGITNSVVHALEKFGIAVEDRRTLTKFIGPPLFDSFTHFYGMDEVTARQAITYYREYFETTGLFENAVYPDIPPVLEELRRRGKRLVVATSKPEKFAVQIMKHFSLDGYFSLIAGATLDDTRIKKADVIAYALAESGADGRSSAMIGDREHDIFGAKANGLYSVGVLYGFGSREELLRAGADAIAATPHALLNIL